MNFQMKIDWKLKPSHMEKVEGKSMTIQGDTLSLGEMLQRFAQGMPTSLSPGSFYESDDEDSPDLEKLSQMDLTEQAELVAEMQAVDEAFKKLDEKKSKPKEVENVTPEKGGETGGEIE